MNISSSSIRDYLLSVSSAGHENIKTLNQAERKTLMAMFTAFQNLTPSLQMSLEDTGRLETIKSKLQGQCDRSQLPKASLFAKIAKAVSNFFGWRISSAALLRSSQEMLEDNATIKKALDDFTKTGTDETSLPSQIIQQSEAFLTGNMQQETNLLNEDLLKLFQSEDGLKEIPATFTHDYERGGICLTIVDTQKQTEFKGDSQFKPEETAQQRLTFHTEGVDKLFSAEELTWKRLVQATVTQSLANAITMPTSLFTNEFAGNRSPFGEEHCDPSGHAFLVHYDTEQGQKEVNVEIQRDSSGAITSCQVSFTAKIPLQLAKYAEGERGGIPVARAGTIESHLSYKLSIENGRPVISDLNVSNQYSS